MKSPVLMIVLCLLVTSSWVRGQSLTTEALRKKHPNALELFFYNNTLRMLNQSEDSEFDEIIKDIEKMRFLMIRKSEANFAGSEYTRLVSDYKSEAFQEIMTSRHEGKNFNIYLKENGGKTKGMLVLVNDADNLYVLDILGRIAVDKVTKLYSTLDESTDVSSKIKAFTGRFENDGDDDDKRKGEN